MTNNVRAALASEAAFWHSVRMLLRLAVQGLALLSDVELQFSPGLNVLTGETGAGKSLILSALGLVAGAPAPKGMRAEIEAEVDLGRWPASLRAELGFSSEKLVVTRSLGAKSKATLNGRALPASELRARVGRAFSFITQGAAREVASGRGVLEALDARAGLTERAARFQGVLTEFDRQKAELDPLISAGPARARDSALLAEALVELDECAPSNGEREALLQKIELQSRAQQYLALAERVGFVLFDREPSVESEVSGLLQAVRRAPGLPVLVRLAEELGSALSALSAAGAEASRLAEELTAEPVELERLERRLETLERLAKRLGVRVEDLPSERDSVSERLSALRAEDERMAELERALSETRERGHRLAAELVERRERALPELALELERELAELALPHARVALALRSPMRDPNDRPHAGRLELGFSANPGEPCAPLERVASGGERSRIALALACVGASRGRTLIFDEIDQGVGGEAVLGVAERLKRLAREQQILCVTHQAVVAARADSHFRVCKRVSGELTRSSVERLNEEQRTLELSRMLAGGRAAAASRVLARRLLEAARAA